MPGEFTQISESIKIVFDLTSRIDERVKILVQGHAENAKRLEKSAEQTEKLHTRLSILESSRIQDEVTALHQISRILEARLTALELQTQSQTAKWTKFFDFVYRLLLALAIAWLAYKLGLRP